ncbi:hypothetical protein OG588_35025 [Streptomyces prunicolor]|uniref:hypothetical protein n=1 Tax=Streptomyces prunicolor TaxID=67348 RepID=UPI00386D86E2|nr:hypothetical protein OG588_35025 [Streptomyces prunicolor]
MTVGAAMLALVAVGTTTAQAATSTTNRPNNCGTGSVYDFGTPKSARIGMVPPSSAPGGHTLGITLTAGTSITGTISGTVSGEEGIIVAKAKESVTASIALTMTASVSYSDSWKVPASWRKGYLHAGADRDTVNWSYGHYGANCKWVVTRHGVAKLPYHIPAFWSSKG